MLRTTCIAGFAMFSMFFGSGNLVFPLLLGTQTLDQYPAAMAGFFVTAVIVPFLGLLAMIVFDGQREKFFNSIGRIPGFLLTFAMLALIGPFGVVPRCITVAYGGLKLIYPELSFALFSAIFTIIVAALIWKPNRIVNIIGVFLTPLKLGSLLLLIVCGLYYAGQPGTTSISDASAFKLGFSTGYQTMDLIAAFFFSATIVNYLRNALINGEHKSALIRSCISASIIGAALLAAVYFGFVSLGASYAAHLTTTNPEALLAAIAGLTMGKYALTFVAITLAVSCLATAVILTSLFVDFARKDIAEEKLGVNILNSLAIALTSLITYAISLLGFAKICSILGFVLELSYPALIALAVHHILTYWVKMNLAKPIFWGILIVTGILQWVF